MTYSNQLQRQSLDEVEVKCIVMGLQLRLIYGLYSHIHVLWLMIDHGVILKILTITVRQKVDLLS